MFIKISKTKMINLDKIECINKEEDSKVITFIASDSTCYTKEFDKKEEAEEFYENLIDRFELSDLQDIFN